MMNASRLLFTDLHHEVDHKQLHIQGAIPEWLSGTLFRNGPASHLDGHLFDGLAMIHKFTLDSGRATYSNRFLRTGVYEQAMKTGKTSSGFATPPQSGETGSNPNVSVMKMDHHFVAMTESPDVVEFDPYSLRTVGVLPYADQLAAHYTTAHPHLDIHQRGLINFTVEFGRTCYYHIYGLPAGSRKRTLIASIETDRPAYMHSFGITENHIVLVEFPLLFHPQELFAGDKPIAECMHWTPGRGTRFLVVGKRSGKLEKIVECGDYFSFHLINAFEKQGDIFIDACTMRSAGFIQSLSGSDMTDKPFSPANQPAMLRFHLAADKQTARVEKLSEEYMEFPGIHYQWANAQDYRFAYGVSTNQLQPENVENQLIKVDTRSGKALTWFQPGHYPGEPVFAPAPGAKAEDDGAILSVVLDGHSGHSYLLILNAESFAEIARAEVPHHIPYGFHGLFTNELFIEERNETR